MKNQIFGAKAKKFENKNRKLTMDYFEVFRLLGKGDISEVYLV